MNRSLNKFLALLLIAAVPATSFALPVDWHGAFGVDSTLISGFRRIKGTSVTTPANSGSQEVSLASGNQESASWQSYILKLSPTMIINDAATFKAEMTTGYASGGFLGDSPQTDMGGANTGNNNVPLYYHNQAKGSNVTIKKAYVELYSDTATYVIGRHTYNWGLGAIYNDGANAWDRHSYSRDGITMKLKIGSFHINPFWSKIANTGYTDSTNAKEYGVGLLYDNEERDIAFGLIYSVKSSSSFNTTNETTINGATQVLGETNVKITDLYLKKKWGNFDFAVEVPLISGDLGKTDSSADITTYSAKAFIIQTNYKLSEAWKFGLDGGQVAGHDGSSKKFGAIYLNPNYQVANLLFRYNIGAIASSTNTESVYDSYITNARYLKIRSSYSSEKWTFDSALIYAKAIEKATAGQLAYNHTKNKNFTAITTQSDDLGTEVDLNATYRWNNEISIGAGIGYLLTGDYFSYTNDANIKNTAENSLLFQINTAVTF